MADKTIELAIKVPVEIRQAIELAAAAEHMPVSDFVERALAKFLVEAGYIDRKAAR